MKNITMLTGALLLCSNLVSAEPAISLNLNFAKFKQLEGKMHFQLLDCANTDMEWSELPVLFTKQVAVSQKMITDSFTNLTAGKYCIRFFQDLNGNGELDLAANTIPKEPVGFSNNPNLMFGQPSPDDSVFELSETRTLKIKVNNKKRR